jgi:hypothetical protein
MPWTGTSWNEEAIMSTFDSHDPETMGYFLPEESQHRLKKLREYVQFLSHLAQPRRAGEGQERMPEVRAGEVAICLELLNEQLTLVLQDIAWPAHRDEAEPALGSDAERAMGKVPDDAEGRYVFGLTVEQVDTLHRLIDMLSAHGDVVTASRGAELATPTLPAVGQAIFDGASAARDIIRQAESQRLEPTRGSQSGVGEEQAVYRVSRARLPVASKAMPLPYRARRLGAMR